MNSIKESVLFLESYSVPQDSSMVKLNQNESPLDLPLEIKDEVFARLRDSSWNRYPSPMEETLLRRIADYTDFPAEGLLIGNGSNELIQCMIQATCDSGDKMVTVCPSFAVYKRIAQVMNIIVEEVPLCQDFSFDVHKIIDKSRDARLVILAIPNNPTGTVLSLEEIAGITKHNKGLVVVDEAYHEFHKPTAQGLIREFDNLLVLRTFSKGLRLAGIRLGYMLGRSEVIEQLLKAKLPFSVGLFQQVVGTVTLEKSHLLQDSIERLITERERIFSRLKLIPGIDSVPSCTNFILFGSKKKNGNSLFQELYERRILVRRFRDSRLDNFLRVTVGLAEENERFLESLEAILGG